MEIEAKPEAFQSQYLIEYVVLFLFFISDYILKVSSQFLASFVAIVAY